MTLRIGVVELGGIAQKAWLPVLSAASDWTLVGAFSPNQAKAQPICDSFRMRCFSSLDDLTAACDAVFVHSSTATHYQVVRALLLAGKRCLRRQAAGGKAGLGGSAGGHWPKNASAN